MPEFDTPVAYFGPSLAQAIAVTPPGLDLVGAADDEPDGYPEVAVAARDIEEFGEVYIYRNKSTTNPPTVELELLLTIDVIAQIDSDFVLDEAIIRDIALVKLTDGDDDPDLIVAISYRDPITSTIFRGIVASFVAERDPITDLLTSYSLINTVDLDYPVTGLAWGEYGTDGRNHILATCAPSTESGSNPSRVFPIANVYDSGTGDYGRLQYPITGVGDLATSPMGSNPTHNIAAGQFSNLTSSGSGTTLDFVAFGAGTSDGITVGVGNSSGAFTFAISALTGTSCGSNTYGFGPGSIAYAGANETAPLVHFDPFSNARKSLATNSAGLEVTLIHNDPRFGSFFHLCDGNDSLDTYSMIPVECEESPPTLPVASSYLAAGRLNADAFDDLVYINGDQAYAALMLGRGTVDSDGRIMDFSNCTNEERYYFVQYATAGSGIDLDRVACVDLNLDGYDEVLITRTDDSELIVLENTTGY